MDENNTPNYSQNNPRPKATGFFNRHKLAIIILSILVLLIGSALTILLIVGSAIVQVGDSCIAKEQRLQAAATSLKDTFNSLVISDSQPDQVYAGKNGDCLTGSGSTASATFNIGFPSITEANIQAARALHTEPLANQKFTIGNTSSSDRIDFIATKIKGQDTNNYTVKYYLRDQINCANFGTKTCIEDEATEARYNYMKKPINKIEVSLAIYVN